MQHVMPVHLTDSYLQLLAQVLEEVRDDTTAACLGWRCVQRSVHTSCARVCVCTCMEPCRCAQLINSYSLTATHSYSQRQGRVLKEVRIKRLAGKRLRRLIDER